MSVKEVEKADIPEVLRNGMAKMVMDNAFLEQVAQLKLKVRVWMLKTVLLRSKQWHVATELSLTRVVPVHRSHGCRCKRKVCSE